MRRRAQQGLQGWIDGPVKDRERGVAALHPRDGTWYRRCANSSACHELLATG
jgi:hypothetical protein